MEKSQLTVKSSQKPLTIQNVFPPLLHLPHSEPKFRILDNGLFPSTVLPSSTRQFYVPPERESVEASA